MRMMVNISGARVFNCPKGSVRRGGDGGRWAVGELTLPIPQSFPFSFRQIFKRVNRSVQVDRQHVPFKRLFRQPARRVSTGKRRIRPVCGPVQNEEFISGLSKKKTAPEMGRRGKRTRSIK